MTLRTELLRAAAACVLFFAFTGIFGFGGCTTLAGSSWGNDTGLIIGFIWFGAVSVGAMMFVLRAFNRPGKDNSAKNSDDPES